jgi:UDP-N-acetylglucosamine--dolichyl-phosphate N-acetylglucosaminephosphotransferase
MKFRSLGIAGIDVHKPDGPLRAEMGGLAVLVALGAGSAILIAFDGVSNLLFGAGLSTVTLAGLIGALDDGFEIRQRYKPFLIAAATLPLMILLINRTTIAFPLVGSIPLGLLYPLFIVPLAVTTSANFANMLAGFNGLEAGIASISISALSLLCAIRGYWEMAALGTLLAVGYLGFLKVNWYPAKIFPGDSGTLLFGAAVATIGLVSHLEFAAIVISMPAALDFTLKLLSRRPFSQRKIFGDTKVESGGTLVPPSYPALSHAFMRVASVTERQLVLSMLATEAVFSSLAISLTLAFL